MNEIHRHRAQHWVVRASWLGPVAFFAAACAWSMLGTQFSTDTWIGLAGGRQILEQLDWRHFQETYPREDIYSYTFYHRIWYNQSWLAHLGQYWVYERIGPAAVIYANWAIVACIHCLVLLAVRWRTGSWPAAWLATALAAIAERDFLEPRAATAGLLCLAALWALLSAIEAQRDRPRWWPVVLLLPVLWLWSNVHGSFTFGCGVLALYCGHWTIVRLCRTKAGAIVALVGPLLVLGLLVVFGANPLFLPPFLLWLPLPLYVLYWLGIRLGAPVGAASGWQVLAIAAVPLAVTGLVAALHPFGIQTFAYAGKIASSEIFRSISEWQPAYSSAGDDDLPTRRFWWMLALTAGGTGALWLAVKMAGRSGGGNATDRGPARWSLLDAVLVLTTLCMALGVRRFAPLFYIISAPVLAACVLNLAARLAPRLRDRCALMASLAAALTAAVTLGVTGRIAYRELVEDYGNQPGLGLLDRVTHHRATIIESLAFMQENRLRLNLLTHYDLGASVMFYAPVARVFFDARMHQLYTEQHVRRYAALMSPSTSLVQIQDTLDGTNTDAVLLRRAAHVGALRNLLASPDWTPVLANADFGLFLRSGSPALQQLGERIREGKEWRPERAGRITPEAQAWRGMVVLNTSPAQPALALNLIKEAVERELSLGSTFYPIINRLMAQLAGPAAAADYVSQQMARVRAAPELSAEARSGLLASLESGGAPSAGRPAGSRAPAARSGAP